MNVGDKVTRFLGGIPMDLKVTEITDDTIVCGPWTFDKKTGAEIDEEIGWGPPTPEEPNRMTGSYIKMPGVQYVEVEAPVAPCSDCGFMKCQC